MKTCAVNQKPIPEKHDCGLLPRDITIRHVTYSTGTNEWPRTYTVWQLETQGRLQLYEIGFCPYCGHKL